MNPAPLEALGVDENLRRQSQSVVVRSGGRSVTHAEFYERARTARERLRDLGVTAGDLVVISGDRSDELFLAVVVALDMRTPFVLLRRDALDLELDRVREALAPRAIVHTDAEPSQAAVRIEVVDRPDQARVVDESVAYVISTSGTTGAPKSVVIGRAQLDAYLRGIVETFALTSSDVVLSAATVGFDVLLEELLPTLLCGATVAILPGELGTTSFSELSDLLADEQITLGNVPSSYFVGWARSLVEAPVRLPALRGIIAGSEPLPVTAVLDAARGGLGHVEVFNAYGTSETTITSTVWTSVSGTPTERPTAPIGAPIVGCEVRLAEPDETDGAAVGELLIGGPTVARGYLGASSDEQARFEPGVLADGSPTTWYRTGDLVALRDGQLWHLGRVDAQLNIRGVRVEPGEIAAAVARVIECEGVEVCQVGERLVACVLRPRDGVPSSWHADLAHLLRPERVPTEVLVVDEFPKLASGKVNSAALRALVVAEPTKASAQTPFSPAELYVLIADVLGVGAVSEGDDLFALGARSIEIARIVAGVNGRYGAVLSLTDVFANPAVSAISHLVADRTENA